MAVQTIHTVTVSIKDADGDSITLSEYDAGGVEKFQGREWKLEPTGTAYVTSDDLRAFAQAILEVLA